MFCLVWLAFRSLVRLFRDYPRSSDLETNIRGDLPREIDYLKRHDLALRRTMNTVEMPDRVAENLLMFIRQNTGTLPKRRRTGEFKRLTDDEVAKLEAHHHIRHRQEPKRSDDRPATARE